MPLPNQQSIQTKNAFFFSHDSNARNDEKIVRLRMKHGAEGYGIYFMLIELLMEASDYRIATDYLSLAFNLHVEEETIRSVIEDFGLFHLSRDKKHFYSQSLLDRVKPLEKIREKRRKAGLRSAEVRRSKKLAAEQQEQTENTCSTPVDKKGTEESREEKSREKKSKGEQSREKAFTPPTLPQVETYCKERKNKVDAQRFVNFYQAKGWMVGKNKMKDWRAAVRSWEQLEQTQAQTRAPNIVLHSNQMNYEQF